MIKSFRHKGLREFFESGKTKGIRQDHVKKLRRILTTLHAAETLDDVNAPDFKLHELKGKDKGVWSVWVNKNWRVIFTFENGDAEIVDYRDYH